MLRGRVIKYGDGPQKETWQLPVSEPVKRERCLKKTKTKAVFKFSFKRRAQKQSYKRMTKMGNSRKQCVVINKFRSLTSATHISQWCINIFLYYWNINQRFPVLLLLRLPFLFAFVCFQGSWADSFYSLTWDKNDLVSLCTSTTCPVC